MSLLSESEPVSIQPSSKKRRLTIDNLQTNPVTRSNIWFDDGSVILQAESTQFRVHRTVLSQQSAFFQDVFSLPQPADGQESSSEGCPVIHVPDSAEDMTHLLSTLYNYPTYGPRVAIPIPVASALLRLGSKYEFTQIREEIIFRLEKEIPTTLQEYDKWHSPDDDQDQLIEGEGGFFIDLTNLAFSEGIFSVLPVLLLTVCIDTTENIYDGVERDDGTLATLLPLLRRTCILKRNDVVDTSLKVNFSFLNKKPISQQCTQPTQCAYQSASLLASMTKPSPQPLCILSRWESGLEANFKKFCEPCRTNAKTQFELGKQKMWDALPGIFDLPPWEQIRNMNRD